MAGSSGLSAAVIFGFDGRTFVVCCRLAKCRQVSTHTAGSITRCPLPCLTYFMNLPLTPHVWLAVCTDRRPRARRPQNPRPTIDAGRRGGADSAREQGAGTDRYPRVLGASRLAGQTFSSYRLQERPETGAQRARAARRAREKRDARGCRCTGARARRVSCIYIYSSLGP